MKIKLFTYLVLLYVIWLPSLVEGDGIASCKRDVCKLPKCYCSGTIIPGNLTKANVPQIIMITFQGAVTEKLMAEYDILFNGKKNPNNCPYSSTIFVQDEYTNYPVVQQLFLKKQEIAVFGGVDSKKTPISLKEWQTQIESQKKNLNQKAGVPLADLNGYRLFGNWAPGGDVQYQALQNANLVYDSSLRCANVGFWPYTFDYFTTQGCPVPECPTGSHPGFWEVPITYFYDSSGVPCAFMDGCRNVKNEVDAFNLLLKNFYKHYRSNRSPFPMYFHETWFERYNYTLPAVLKFMDVISNMQDVYVVSMNQTIQWVKQPTPLSSIKKFKPWGC